MVYTQRSFLLFTINSGGNIYSKELTRVPCFLLVCLVGAAITARLIEEIPQHSVDYHQLPSGAKHSHQRHLVAESTSPHQDHPPVQ
jgi:hypothetical protein